MMRALFLQAPSFDGYDGGAGARYQMQREVRSFWYPTWLAQPAAMVPGSKLIDAPAHDLGWEDIAHEFDAVDLVILHTSTPSFNQDVRTAGLIKQRNPAVLIGFVGAKVAVEPDQRPTGIFGQAARGFALDMGGAVFQFRHLPGEVAEAAGGL